MSDSTATTFDHDARLRLFLALLPDAATRGAIARHADRWPWGGGETRYAPADWHVTLHFLGSVPRQRVDRLADALTVGFAPFGLAFGHAECWPHGLAVLCPNATPAPLLQLHQRLAQVLHEHQLPVEERPYRPHLTLARRAQVPVAPADAVAFTWWVDSYALVCSSGDPTRRYPVLRHYPAGLPAH